MSLFDSEAPDYDRWFETKMGRHADDAETECAMELMRPEKGMRILDVGCGTGNFSLKLARLGCHVTGIDLSEKMLAEAQEKARQEKLSLDFFLMNGEEMSFGDETFDGVVSMAAFEFMKDRAGAVDEMFRVLKRGAFLLLGTINRDSPWGEMYLRAGAEPGSLFSHARLLTMEELQSFRPGELREVRECLFTPPDAPEEDLSPEGEAKWRSKGRGGFLWALWKKS